MRIDVITIFPEMFPGWLGSSMLKRAQAGGAVDIHVHDLRAYTHDKRRTVDDRPYGGGPGMIMKPEPIFEAVEAIHAQAAASQGKATAPHIVLTAPAGERLSTELAEALAGTAHLMIICGHYEGVDERVRTALADRTVSIGDYVLTGGELPAMVLIDCIARFVPGVIGHAQATDEESFRDGWLEYPQYTRPPVFRNLEVPEVLRSGDHEQIARWRKLQSVARTMVARPDPLHHEARPSHRGSSWNG